MSDRKGNIDLSNDVFRVLLDLYGVVIALALTAAIGITISPNGVALSPLQLNQRQVTLFLAFFVTIVPFYHGASVYLLRTYTHGNPSTNRRAPLVDFITLTLEGVIFYAIAASINTIKSFIAWLALLFLLDIVWIGLTYFKQSSIELSDGVQTLKLWAKLDVMMIVFLIGMMIVFLIGIGGVDASSWTQIYYLILAVAIIRTAIDYLKSYHYYFPLTKKTDSKTPRPV